MRECKKPKLSNSLGQSAMFRVATAAAVPWRSSKSGCGPQPSRQRRRGCDVTRQLRGIDGGETELGRTFGGVHCGSSRLKGQRPCHGNATELVSKGAWAWGCPGIASLFELRVSGSGLNMQGLGFNIKIHCFAISVQGYKWVCRTRGGNLQPSSSSSPGFEKHEFLKQRWDLVQHEARQASQFL